MYRLVSAEASAIYLRLTRAPFACRVSCVFHQRRTEDKAHVSAWEAFSADLSEYCRVWMHSLSSVDTELSRALSPSPSLSISPPLTTRCPRKHPLFRDVEMFAPRLEKRQRLNVPQIRRVLMHACVIICTTYHSSIRTVYPRRCSTWRYVFHLQ